MNQLSRRPFGWLLLASLLFVSVWKLRPPARPPEPAAPVAVPTLVSAPVPATTTPPASAEAVWNGWRAQLPAAKPAIEDVTEWPANRTEPFDKFRDWQQRHRAAADKAALESEGVALAQARRAAMKRWIERDPEFALAQAVGPDARRELPEEILVELERWVEGKGGFEVMVRCGPNVKPADRITRNVRVAGEDFRAFVYGRRVGQTTKYDVPLHGVAVDGLLALHSSPVRQLEPGEVRARGLDAAAIHLETGGEVAFAAHAPEAFAIEARLIQRESGLGPYPTAALLPPGVLPAGLPPGTAAFPPTPGHTMGNKRILIIRVDFSDEPGTPTNTLGGAAVDVPLINSVMATVTQFYSDNSQNQTTILPTVLPAVLRMPRTKAEYATLDPMSDLRLDALAAARAFDQANGNTGISNPDTYDWDATVFSEINGANFGFAGLAFVGAKGLLVNGSFDLRVMAHELGHNYGLNHANRWDVTGTDPIDPAGTHNEYGDDYDMMGANNLNTAMHFNEWFKAYLGWLNATNWRAASTSGVYRLFRHDHFLASGLRGITVGQTNDRAYWLGYRRNFALYPSAGTNFLANGVELRWGMQSPGITNDMSGNASRLLNFTPATANFSRHPLPVGQTFTDPNHNLSITPVSVGGAFPNEFVDVNISFSSPPATITAHPTNISVLQGGTAVFSVTAAGAGPISYQWAFNSVNIPGATSSTLTLNNVATNQAGTYFVRVTNPGGTVNSSNATLTVTSTNLSLGGLLAHWRFDEPPGATVAADVTGNFPGTNSPNGAAFVTGGRAGNAISIDRAANGFVRMGNVLPLTNTDFTISAWIRPPAGDVTFNANFLSKHFSGSVNGYILSYGWFGDLTNKALSYAGSRLTNSVQEVVTSSSDVNDGAWHQVALVYRLGTTTSIFVDGAPTEGSISSSPILANTAPFIIGGNMLGAAVETRFQGLLDEVQIYNRALNDAEVDFLFQNPGQSLGGAPVITVPPQNVAAAAGANVTFTVTATGTGPFAYQWLFNGVAIPGATGATLTLANVQAANAGNYSVRVSNASGSTTSAPAVLDVITYQPLAHWKFDEAPGGTIAVDSRGNFNGTNSPTGAAFVLGGRAGNALSLTRAQSGFVNMGDVLPLTDVNYSLVAWVRTAPGDVQDDQVVLGRHVQGFKNGYQLLLNTTGGALIPGRASLVTGGSGLLPWLSAETPVSTTPVNDGNWHQIVAVHDLNAGTKRIYVDGAPAEDAKPVQSNNVPLNRSFLIGGVSSGFLPIGLFDGLLDDIQVYNRPLTDGEINFLFQNPGQAISGAPVIESPPPNVTVVLGGTAVFSVTNSGIAPFTYQWRFNGTNLPGATGPVLTLNNVQSNQAGLYSVRVDNAQGFTISTNAILTVLLPPFITAQPTNFTVLAGGTATFSVSAGGTPPLSFEWRFNGTNLPGATSATLTVPNAQVGNQGNYSVLVGNPYGSVTSSNAVLTVNSPPVITQQPRSRVATVASPVGFTVGAAGNAPFTYQWRFNGAAIPGATNSAHAIPGVVSAHAGIYSVLVTNAFGSAASGNAALTVIPARVLSPWGAAAGGVGADAANAVAVDGAGNAFVAGYFTGTATFGTNELVSAGARDGFLAKFDPAGRLLWVRRMGGAGFDAVHAVATDTNGNCYLAGEFEGIAVFGANALTNANPVSYSDAFVAKFDAGGTNVWARAVATRDLHDTAHAVALDGAGNVFVAGQSPMTNFNATVLANHGRAFVAKFNNAGAPQWARKAGGGGLVATDNTATGVAADAAGNVYVAGVFAGTDANFDGGFTLANRGGTDAFLARYDGAGAAQWVRQIGGVLDDRANGLAVDSAGNAYVVGDFAGTTQLPGVTLSTGVSDQNAFIARFDAAGTVNWARQAGGTLPDAARAVSVDAGDRVFVAGYFSGAATFGSETIVSVGNTFDAFLARLDTNGNFAFAQQAGGSDLGGDIALGVAADAAGNAILTGYFNGASALGGASPESAGGEDIFVARFNAFAGDAPPPLAFQPSPAGRLRLSWPAGSSSFILQSSPTLFNPVWTDVIGDLLVQTNDLVLTNTPGPVNRFYRLRKP
jgi:M6 family metalloprotease-like protein